MTRFLEYARLHVKESSFEFYVGAVARLLNYADLANAQISKINPEIVARFAGSRKAASVSVSAINGDLRTLRRLLRLAFEWEVIPRAPVVHALPGERTRDRVISFEEEQKYLAFSGPNLMALTVLAVDTGMRPKSELFRLEWPQVHLEPSEMMPNGYIKVKEGKTHSAERVPPTDAESPRNAPYIKDGAPAEALGLSGARQFRAPGQHSEITPQSSQECRLGTVSVLLLASHVRYQMRRERNGPAYPGQTDGAQLTTNHRKVLHPCDRAAYKLWV